MSEAILIDSFAEIEEIVLLAVCGAISGADDFVALEEFGESKLDWF